jgi:hypothetical protein
MQTGSLYSLLVQVLFSIFVTLVILERKVYLGKWHREQCPVSKPPLPRARRKVILANSCIKCSNVLALVHAQVPLTVKSVMKIPCLTVLPESSKVIVFNFEHSVE